MIGTAGFGPLFFSAAGSRQLSIASPTSGVIVSFHRCLTRIEPHPSIMPRPPSKPTTPRDRALNLLSRREQSQRELKRKLVNKGVTTDEAETAVESLTDASLQSNERFAGMMVRRRVGDGHGPMRIAAELSSHGIDRDAIRAAIDEEAPDWQAIAEQVYRRKYAGKPAQDSKERMKRAGWLAQRGFPLDIARRVAAMVAADDD